MNKVVPIYFREKTSNRGDTTAWSTPTLIVIHYVHAYGRSHNKLGGAQLSTHPSVVGKTVSMSERARLRKLLS